MRLSPHFTLEEMVKSQTALRMGLDNSPGPDQFEALVSLCEFALEPIRNHYERPVIVSTSPSRAVVIVSKLILFSPARTVSGRNLSSRHGHARDQFERSTIRRISARISSTRPDGRSPRATFSSACSTAITSFKISCAASRAWKRRRA